MVSGSVIEIDGVPKIYIDPNPIHAKLSFHETMETAKALIAANPYKVLYVEEVNYQKAAVQEAERVLLPVMPMKAGVDKRSRLKVAATYIQNGTVIFPRTGCEDLLIELLGFGVEAHDDLVDAVVYLILGLVQNNFRKFECETV
jgi:predicted phage terminase large subunit-like protein